MLAAHDQIVETALRWIESGKKAALATVVQTWGSAPRPAGSQLVISQDAEIQGSVSGGCVESAVVSEALDALEDGKCRLLEYGVSDDDAFAVGLACGGTIRIMVEPIAVGQGPSIALLQDLAARRLARQAAVLATNTDTWERRFVDGDDPFADLAEKALLTDKSGFQDQWFLAVYNPPLRMVVVGAVHIAQPLSVMARETGYDVHVIDPREAFGAQHRFPDLPISNDWPDEALENLGIDARTALVTLSHDPKIDDPALTVGLASQAFYIGALGSNRTHAKRVARFTEAGFSHAQISKIHAPVGANIGSSTPAEIALSILAQVTERLRRPDTRPPA